MPDFGFVGASYSARSIYQDDQECINFYPEIDATKQPGERGIVSLYPTPGLTQELQLTGGEVRGMRALSGNQYAIVVVGKFVYRLDKSLNVIQIGTLLSNKGQVRITDNVMSSEGLTAYIVDGGHRYYYNVSSNSFVTLGVEDGGWEGATVCDTVDDYIAYNQPGTQNWAVTDLGSPLSTTFLFGAKNGSPDNIVSLIVDHRQVYVLGEVTSEVWVNVGGTLPGIVTFPFQRISGTSMQHGCAAPYSVARFADSFMFVARDTLGTATIGKMTGYQYQRLSTHAVENSLSGQNVSDAIAYSYQIDGHEFYVVTFPSIDLTWVFDLTTQQWHKWLSWDTVNATYKRHRSNCYMFFSNTHMVGDFENGKIYKIDLQSYSDDGAVIRRLRRASHITSDLQRQYFEEFQIQFQPGVGLNNGQGQDPQAILRWSNDGGSTWSNEHWASIGKIGRYSNRAIWRRLGWARDRIFEVVITDPVKAVIISANLKASVGNN